MILLFPPGIKGLTILSQDRPLLFSKDGKPRSSINVTITTSHYSFKDKSISGQKTWFFANFNFIFNQCLLSLYLSAKAIFRYCCGPEQPTVMRTTTKTQIARPFSRKIKSTFTWDPKWTLIGLRFHSWRLYC